MMTYTYWVQAVYYIQDDEYEISFPDFGPRIKPFRIASDDSIEDRATEVLQAEIQKIANKEDLPVHSNEFPIDTQFVDPSHIKILKINIYSS